MKKENCSYMDKSEKVGYLTHGPVPDHLWTKIYQHKHPQSARNRTYRHSTALIEISTSNNLFGFHNSLLQPLPNSTLNVSTYFYKCVKT